MTVPDLMILRHGETEWNRVGRMQGALDSPLTDIGTQQAQRQVLFLKHSESFFSFLHHEAL